MDVTQHSDKQIEVWIRIEPHMHHAEQSPSPHSTRDGTVHVKKGADSSRQYK